MFHKVSCILENERVFFARTKEAAKRINLECFFQKRMMKIYQMRFQALFQTLVLAPNNGAVKKAAIIKSSWESLDLSNYWTSSRLKVAEFVDESFRSNMDFRFFSHKPHPQNKSFEHPRSNRIHQMNLLNTIHTMNWIHKTILLNRIQIRKSKCQDS